MGRLRICNRKGIAVSVDHTFEVCRDDTCKVFLNISGVNTDDRDTEGVSANLYAYDVNTGDSKFTCNLSINELSELYHHLDKYTMVKEVAPIKTGKFVEVKGNTKELLSLLSSANETALIPALKGIVGSRLSDTDINIILGRKDSLEEFHTMLVEPSSRSEPEWQAFFERNEWIFGYGLKYKYLRILQREAHVSRTDLNGGNDVISDFLLSDARYTKLVELKTPATKLFENRRNRSDSWRLSTDLSDAVSQILAQKANWEIEGAGDNYTDDGELISEASFNVECILIVGMHSAIQGTDRERKMKSKTLELYRRNLRNIDIVFYDELYERAKYIVDGA